MFLNHNKICKIHSVKTFTDGVKNHGSRARVRLCSQSATFVFKSTNIYKTCIVFYERPADRSRRIIRNRPSASITRAVHYALCWRLRRGRQWLLTRGTNGRVFFFNFFLLLSYIFFHSVGGCWRRGLHRNSRRLRRLSKHDER